MTTVNKGRFVLDIYIYMCFSNKKCNPCRPTTFWQERVKLWTGPGHLYIIGYWMIGPLVLYKNDWTIYTFVGRTRQCLSLAAMAASLCPLWCRPTGPLVCAVMWRPLVYRGLFEAHGVHSRASSRSQRFKDWGFASSSQKSKAGGQNKAGNSPGNRSIHGSCGSSTGEISICPQDFSALNKHGFLRIFNYWIRWDSYFYINLCISLPKFLVILKFNKWFDLILISFLPCVDRHYFCQHAL